MDRAELTTEEVLQREIPWETYVSTKLITGTCLQLLRRYDKRPGSQKAALLDEDGPAYIRVFVNILRDISKEETVEYVLALIDEMLSANPNRARIFHDKSLSSEDTYEAFLRSIPTVISCLATLLREPFVRVSFVQADGVKLLIPLISPTSTQQAVQLLYETCLCIWLLSYYDAAVDYMATTRIVPRLIDVVKGSTKEKVVRVVIFSFHNLLSKEEFAAQMIDLGLPQIVQNLKSQAWSDEDLLNMLNQLEQGLKDSIKRSSSFDKYKQEVLLGHLDWSPMHKDPGFWRENITHLEENDFQVLRVLVTILDTSGDATALAVACYDLSQFLQYHPSGRLLVSDLQAKEKVMKLMNHENVEVTKNALLCIQRLFLGTKFASFLQA